MRWGEGEAQRPRNFGNRRRLVPLESNDTWAQAKATMYDHRTGGPLTRSPSTRVLTADASVCGRASCDPDGTSGNAEWIEDD